MLGNGLVIDLYFTGISRLFRAPETATNYFFFLKKVNLHACTVANVRKKGKL